MDLRANTTTRFRRRRSSIPGRDAGRGQAPLQRHGSFEDEKNQIWTAIKTVPDWKNDINADITVSAAQPVGTSGAGGATYTVKAGDTSARSPRITSATPTHT